MAQHSRVFAQFADSVTPQDSVESAGFRALERAKTLFIQPWGDLAHRDAVYSTHSTPFCGVTKLRDPRYNRRDKSMFSWYRHYVSPPF
jgi:hypothetical protein